MKSKENCLNCIFDENRVKMYYFSRYYHSTKCLFFQISPFSISIDRCLGYCYEIISKNNSIIIILVDEKSLFIKDISLYPNYVFLLPKRNDKKLKSST